jgi:hypothetical protein
VNRTVRGRAGAAVDSPVGGPCLKQ